MLIISIFWAATVASIDVRELSKYELMLPDAGVTILLPETFTNDAVYGCLSICSKIPMGRCSGFIYSTHNKSCAVIIGNITGTWDDPCRSSCRIYRKKGGMVRKIEATEADVTKGTPTTKTPTSSTNLNEVSYLTKADIYSRCLNIDLTTTPTPPPPTTTTTTTATTSTAKQCPEPFVIHEGYCLFLLEFGLDAKQAGKECRGRNSYLSYIDSREKLFLVDQFIRRQSSIDSYKSFVGIRRRRGSEIFEYEATHEPFPETSELWHNGYPVGGDWYIYVEFDFYLMGLRNTRGFVMNPAYSKYDYYSVCEILL